MLVTSHSGDDCSLYEKEARRSGISDILQRYETIRPFLTLDLFYGLAHNMLSKPVVANVGVNLFMES